MTLFWNIISWRPTGGKEADVQSRIHALERFTPVRNTQETGMAPKSIWTGLWIERDYFCQELNSDRQVRSKSCITDQNCDTQ
jgi:hypothetical protein